MWVGTRVPPTAAAAKSGNRPDDKYDDIRDHRRPEAWSSSWAFLDSSCSVGSDRNRGTSAGGAHASARGGSRPPFTRVIQACPRPPPTARTFSDEGER